MSRRPLERMLLAEEWRLLGEKLRKRSPAAFEKLLELLAASALDEQDDDARAIDEIYRYH